MVKKIKSSLKKNTEKTKLKKQTSPKKVIKKKETNGKNPAPKRNNTVLADRHRMIQEAAYYRAEKRNFFGGDPVEDWVASEAEIEARLNNSATS